MSISRWRIMASGLAVLLALPAGVQAGGTRTFRVDDFRQVPGLELRGMAVSRGGGLVPGLQASPLAGPALPVVWKVMAAADGTVYAAGGDPGTLLRLPADNCCRCLVGILDQTIGSHGQNAILQAF